MTVRPASIALVVLVALSCNRSKDLGGPGQLPSGLPDAVAQPDMPIERRDAGPEVPYVLPAHSGPGEGAEGFHPSGPLAIPKTHPRIWWNAERLAKARRWIQDGRNRERLEDAARRSDARPLDMALHSVVTGNPDGCKKAVGRTVAYKLEDKMLDQGPCNDCRWDPWPYIVYDWCYGTMSEAERKAIVAKFDNYLTRISKTSLSPDHSGHLGAPANNYFWGYMRNELLWGLASYNDSALAQKHLDFALERRWKGSAVPFLLGRARGGVGIEGSQYGLYQHEYGVFPFVSLGLHGRNVLRETPAYREAIAYWIYTTLPKPTPTLTGRAGFYQFFPFADDEVGGFPTAQRDIIGNFMTAMATEFRDVPIGAYARRWLKLVRPSVSLEYAIADIEGPERPFSDLPLDYYAPGPGMMFARTSFEPTATVLQMQLGEAEGPGGHAHRDAGTFQMWRDGRWLTKESTLYADTIHGGNGQGSVAHNAMLFSTSNWQGFPYGLANGYQKGLPVVTRVESQKDYVYGSVDLSAAYQTTESHYYETLDGVEVFRDHNPYVNSHTREMLFVRPLEALVVLDRVSTRGAKEDRPTQDKWPTFQWGAADVTMAFAVQTHMKDPRIVKDERRVEIVSQAQALRVHTPFPEGVEYAVVDHMKGRATGSGWNPDQRQYRIDIKAKGGASAHMVNVLVAGASNDAPVSVSAKDKGSTIEVSLAGGAKGQALIVFEKGTSSRGGTIAVVRGSGTLPQATPLRNNVQPIRVGNNGPVWGK